LTNSAISSRRKIGQRCHGKERATDHARHELCHLLFDCSRMRSFARLEGGAVHSERLIEMRPKAVAVELLAPIESFVEPDGILMTIEEAEGLSPVARSEYRGHSQTRAESSTILVRSCLSTWKLGQALGSGDVRLILKNGQKVRCPHFPLRVHGSSGCRSRQTRVLAMFKTNLVECSWAKLKELVADEDIAEAERSHPGAPRQGSKCRRHPS
jgi:hypothetical protein